MLLPVRERGNADSRTKRPAEIELIRKTAFPSDFRDRLRTVQKQVGRPFSAGRRG